MDNDQFELFGELLEDLKVDSSLIDMEAWWGVVICVLLVADFGQCFLEIFDVVGKPHVDLTLHLRGNSHLIGLLRLDDFEEFSVVLDEPVEYRCGRICWKNRHWVG